MIFSSLLLILQTTLNNVGYLIVLNPGKLVDYVYIATYMRDYGDHRIANAYFTNIEPII